MPKAQTTTDYQASEMPNVDLITTSKQSNVKKVKKVTEFQPALSKSVLRKIAKIAREKDAKQHRLHSLQILQEHQFDGDKRVLFQQSGTIGTDRTKAEELARLYALQQSGVKLDDIDRAVLKEALVEFGDIENSLEYAEKKKKKMSAYAMKTATSNPFMPLSSASQTISSTLQDRMLTKGTNTGLKTDDNKYSMKELSQIADKMTVTDYDAKYNKQVKFRQRREATHLLKDRLRNLNGKKLHEYNSDDDETLDRLTKEHDMLIVLPKELSRLSDAITNQTGGKVRVVTSNVQGAQLGRNHKQQTLFQKQQQLDQSQTISISANATKPQQNSTSTDDGMRAAANLISRGLLTTKTSDKLDALFAMDSFSDDSDATDSETNDTNNNAQERDLWGVSSKPKQSENKKLIKSKQPIKGDIIRSAAVPKSSKSAGSNDNDDYTSQMPASLAMPTITRTHKAASLIKDMPIAIIANHSADNQPIQIIKRAKNTPMSAQSEQSLVQLPQSSSSNEYKVGFQVLKSRDVRNFLHSVHQGVNGVSSDDENSDMGEEETLNRYLQLHGHNNADMKPIEDEAPKKRRLLFDFSGPITAGPVSPEPKEEQIKPQKNTKAKKSLPPVSTSKISLKESKTVATKPIVKKKEEIPTKIGKTTKAPTKTVDSQPSVESIPNKISKASKTTKRTTQ